MSKDDDEIWTGEQALAHIMKVLGVSREIAEAEFIKAVRQGKISPLEPVPDWFKRRAGMKS